MSKSKKGISPLIATVLIIGFTVALAAVIMTWGTKFTKDIQESTSESASSQISCAQDVVLTIKSACSVNSDNVNKITIANDGNTEITGFKLRLYKDANSVTSLDSASARKIGALDVITISTDILTDVLIEQDVGTGPVQKIELIPSITVGGKKVACTQNVATYGEIGSDLDLC